METAIIFIMLLVGISFVLKLTFMRPWQMVVEAVVLAVAAVVSTNLATSQSKTLIQEWLQTPDLMLDLSVILTVDVALQLAFCILSVGSASNSSTNAYCNANSYRQRLLQYGLLFLPGLLIFPVVFECLVQLIFAFPGTDFNIISGCLAAGLIILLPVAAAGTKLLLPEPPMRLELIFYLNCIIALLGVVASVNGRTAAVGVDKPDFSALAAVLVLSAAAACAGSILYIRKNNKHTHL